MKKKRIVFTGILLMIILLNNMMSFAMPVSDKKTQEDAILYEYTDGNTEPVVFTMDLFNETFTREDVKNMLKADKAAKFPASYEYKQVVVTDAEIDAFYGKVEALAAREPYVGYYFSRRYWRFRTDAYYGPNTISLTLVPTDVTKNNHDLEITMASWALVKAECGSSQYWTNEGSLEQQFRCHALGEIWYPGEVGDWDLEPIRPDVGLIEFAINKCNPTG